MNGSEMRTFILIGFAALLAFIGYSQWTFLAQATARERLMAMSDFPIVGEAAPDFTLPDLAGSEVPLADYTGRPLIINFWTTWCGVCVHELPLFEEFYERYGDQVGLLTVCSGTSPEKAKELVKENSLTFPVLYDDGRTIAGLYQPPRPRDKRRIIAFPFTVFVDGTGTVIYAKIGAFVDMDRLVSLLRKAGFTLTEPEEPPPPPPNIDRRGVQSGGE